MTDIEQRARDALNAAYGYLCYVATRREDNHDIEAMCREIEAHDATKAELADFKREVSEAVKAFANVSWTPDTCKAQWNALVRFIQPDPVKVDPLLIEARKMLAEDLQNGHFDFFQQGVMMKSGAGRDAIMAGVFDNNFYLSRYLQALKRGLTITEGDAK